MIAPVTELQATAELGRMYGPGTSRRSNLALVLAHLNRNGPRSRTELVAETGLAKAAVTSATGDLLDWGLVTEHEVVLTGQSGRPSRPLGIAGDWVHGLGIEVGAHRLAGVVCDLAGNLVAHFDRTGPELVYAPEPAGGSFGPGGHDALRALVADMLAVVASRGAVAAGVIVSVLPDLGTDAVERVVEATTGVLAETAPDLVPVLDADLAPNLAALAEYRARGPADDRTVVSLVGAGSVATGLVVDGDRVRGATGLAGDLGHLVVDPLGVRCRCGSRGCVETVIGVEAVLREAAPALAGDPAGLRCPGVVDEVVSRAAQRDPAVVAGLDRIGWWLGIVIAALEAAYDPDEIVLDGFFSPLAPFVLDAAAATAAEYRSGLRLGPARLAVSGLSGNASIIGAARAAVEEVFEDPLDRLLTSVGGA